MPGRVLIVEDDAPMRALLVEELSERGWTTFGAGDAASGLAALEADGADVLVTDLNLGGATGLDLCRSALARDPDLPVVLITAFGSLQTAIEALRAGAYDFVTKPFATDVLEMAVERAMSHRALKREVSRLRATLRTQGRRSRLEGVSPVMSRLRDQVAQVADTRATVLLLGESGAGKEVVAREIHDLSSRAKKPFVAENVAAIPSTLVESTLFGHVRGAFTGATTARDGLFRAANGGTLLLDEIGELALDLQPKLLRVLEEGVVRPVGSDQPVPVDVRVIAATHRDLEEAVENGRFRQDLYFRLAVVDLQVPPLRARGGDILLLAQRFLEAQAALLGRDVRGLHHETAARLLAWTWPGNVRELKNAMERAVMSAHQALILPADLPPRLASLEPAPHPPPQAAPELLSLEEVERRHVLAVLSAVPTKSEAARVLGIGRKTLYRKLEAWGVEVGRDDPPEPG